MGKERNNYQIGIYLEKALNEKNMSIKQLSNFTRHHQQVWVDINQIV